MKIQLNFLCTKYIYAQNRHIFMKKKLKIASTDFVEQGREDEKKAKTMYLQYFSCCVNMLLYVQNLILSNPKIVQRLIGISFQFFKRDK